MAEGELEIQIELENMQQIKEKLDRFPIELKQTIYRSNQRTANMVEKQLKAVTGFTDRTGKLRRSFYADATFNPLGITFGSLDPKAVYVAYPHGTWQGSWWESFKRRMVPQIIDKIKRAIEKAVRKFNMEEG